jgi:two-component system response regulator LytT
MNDKLHCIIVEDEVPAAQELKYVISQYHEIVVDDIISNGEDGIRYVRSRRPNAVFVDINMPLKNGVELAREIKNFDNLIDIIFVTAYEEHAVEAFRLYALDYVLKPFDEKRIDITVNRLIDKWRQKSMEDVRVPEMIEEIMSRIDKEKKIVKKMPCEKNGKIFLVNIKEIYFCFTKDEKTYVKTSRGVYVIGYSLYQIEEKTSFFRTHRSYLVNMDNIKEMYSWFNGTYKLIMDDDENSEIPISRNNVKKLKKYLKI